MSTPTAFADTADVGHWIGGQRQRGGGARTQTVWNPTTGQPARQVLLAVPDDVANAVAAAQAAQPAWGDMPPIRRARVLNQFLALLLCQGVFTQEADQEYE